MKWRTELHYARLMINLGLKAKAYDRLIAAMQHARQENAPIAVRALIIMAVNAAHDMVSA